MLPDVFEMFWTVPCLYWEYLYPAPQWPCSPQARPPPLWRHSRKVKMFCVCLLQVKSLRSAKVYFLVSIQFATSCMKS